jgi:hypothetical protein
MTTVTFGYRNRAMQLTDEHAASCHGIPVLVADGKVYGPNDVFCIDVQNVGSAWGEVHVPLSACAVAQYAAITMDGEWMPKGTLHRDMFDRFASARAR